MVNPGPTVSLSIHRTSSKRRNEIVIGLYSYPVAAVDIFHLEIAKEFFEIILRFEFRFVIGAAMVVNLDVGYPCCFCTT